MILLETSIDATWLWIIAIIITLIIISIIRSNNKLSTRLQVFEKGEKMTDELINSRAQIMMLDWKIKYEAAIREDAIKRSTAVHTGKVTEHFIPFMKGFGYNVRDVRFIGSPIDLIIFDGHYDKKDEVTIIFTEVKTGKSRLSPAQHRIKEAILDRRVIWWETGGDFDTASKI